MEPQIGQNTELFLHTQKVLSYPFPIIILTPNKVIILSCFSITQIDLCVLKIHVEFTIFSFEKSPLAQPNIFTSIHAYYFMEIR